MAGVGVVTDVTGSETLADVSCTDGASVELVSEAACPDVSAGVLVVARTTCTGCV
ncbi:MAG: hypothetical protein JF612_06770 [Planctomycetia bacterium]|nr:hypothetical protein [Planctomycetia bacterium]